MQYLDLAISTGEIKQNGFGYYYIDLKETRKDRVLKLTLWLMEDVNCGKLTFTRDRFGYPMFKLIERE